LSAYSPELVPNGCWSLLLEVCDTPHRPVTNPFTLIDHCLESLRHAGLCHGTPVARWQRYRRYGYPTPTLDRQRWLAPLLWALEARGVVSAGRFGAWQYERGNMDHCVKQGQDAAERLLERAI
jgi:protoporphyrinogen oxidase